MSDLDSEHRDQAPPSPPAAATADEAPPAQNAPTDPPIGSDASVSDSGPDTLHQLSALKYLEQFASYREPPEAFREPADLPPADRGLNVGPNTTGQLIALNHLEQISSFQGSPSKRLPGPATSDRLLDLRRLDPFAFVNQPGKGQRRYLTWIPLLVVLAVQGWLASRLLWANTAFTDEASYLVTGHLEWAHWLHGTPIPSFPTYLSGAPVIYPPLGAVADSIDGLTGARLLSMAFMLGSTWLLWATTSRLFGKRAGFFAAALFALLGPTLKLSAFATYDAMAVFLIALATWCAVRAGQSKGVSRWMVAAACSLVLADVTAYSYAIMDPVVIGVVLLAGWPLPSVKGAMSRAVALIAYTVALVIGLLTIAGGLYDVGIERTVLDRALGTDTPRLVLTDTAHWIGIVVILALVAILVSLKCEREPARRVLLAMLVVAALLVPLEQARLHTTVSLDKHADMGAWFAAIAAGYAVSRLTNLRGPRILRILATGLAAVALVFPGRIALSQGRALFASWPNSANFVAYLRPLLEESSGHLLVETPSIAEYYIPQVGSQWTRWSSTSSIRLNDDQSVTFGSNVLGVGNPETYISYIKKQFFTVIVLAPSQSSGQFDTDLTNYLDQDPDYVPLRQLNSGGAFYRIWVIAGGSK